MATRETLLELRALAGNKPIKLKATGRRAISNKVLNWQKKKKGEEEEEEEEGIKAKNQSRYDL